MGHIAICPKFDETAFKTFRDAFRGEGPEGIPESSNTPAPAPVRASSAGQLPGYSPSVTLTVVELPFWRTILTLTVWPGLCAASTVPSASEVGVGLPSTATITSPALSPALAAGVPLVTLPT